MISFTILTIIIITSILIVNITTNTLVNHITSEKPTKDLRYRGGGEFALIKRKYNIPPVVSRRNRNGITDW